MISFNNSKLTVVQVHQKVCIRKSWRRGNSYFLSDLLSQAFIGEGPQLRARCDGLSETLLQSREPAKAAFGSDQWSLVELLLRVNRGIEPEAELRHKYLLLLILCKALKLTAVCPFVQ